MGEVCLPGLQGFPVMVTGWSGFLDKVTIVAPNDIQLQFSPSEVPMSYDVHTGSFNINMTNTFFMDGSQYTVRAIRLAKPKQEGISNMSTAPIAELCIWGMPNVNSQPKATVAVLVIPIYIKSESTDPGEAIYELYKNSKIHLMDTIPQGRGTDVIRYSTCVENSQGKTTTITVAYWAYGAAMTQAQANRFLPTLSPWGVPDILGYNLLTIYEQHATTREGRVYNKIRGLLRPYQAAIALGVTTLEFKNSFRLIQDFSQEQQSSQETSKYKCIRIDRSRDIKNNKLLIDPATGRRFDKELNDINANETENNQPTIGAGTIWLKICMVLGIILGISVLAGVLIVIGQMLFTRKSAGLPPTSEGIIRLAESLGPQAGT
jgi:hypothetical protein